MNERLSKIINHPTTIPTTVGVISLGIGLGIGYILGRKRYAQWIEPSDKQMELDFSAKKVFDHEAMEKWIETKEKRGIYRQDDPIPEYRNGKLVSPEEEKIDILPTPEPEELVTRHIFPDKIDDWDYDEEVKNRTEELPYVIHKDEFYANELEYTQLTLTYYSGDDILVDEDETPVYNHAEVVGPMLFGHGSGDPNVFHVRNDKRKAEYEILYDPGLYSVEILGLQIEDNDRAKGLKHAGPRKFRQED